MSEVAEVETMTKVITANSAAAWGAFLGQTPGRRRLSHHTANDDHRDIGGPHFPSARTLRFITVESEHSALSACAGASYAGSRVFTATSSQGSASHARDHSLGGGWTIAHRHGQRQSRHGAGMEYLDRPKRQLSQRDTGWMQVYCTSAQEVLDTVIFGLPGRRDRPSSGHGHPRCFCSVPHRRGGRDTGARPWWTSFSLHASRFSS